MIGLQRILIVACTARKSTVPELIPAIERYDGPVFRVLRKYRKQYPEQLPDIYILSAKYGLIASSYEISNYDMRLTPDRAALLNPTVLNDLSCVFRSSHFGYMCICITRDYGLMIEGWESAIPDNVAVKIIQGTPGQKLSKLYEWLYQEASPAHHISPSGSTRIRGIDLRLSADQVLDLIREKLAQGDNRATACHAWCVRIDGQTVAPKWIVSQISGLPVSAFGGSEARRVLEQLGLSVTRV